MRKHTTIQTEQPKNGQWIAIWSYKGKSWSDTVRFTNGRPKAYRENDDGDPDWIEHVDFSALEVTYIQLGEDYYVKD